MRPPASPTLAVAVFSIAASCARERMPELIAPALNDTAVRQAYDNAVRDPRDAQAAGMFGMQLHARLQLESAIVAYKRASMLDPTSFRWAYFLGVANQSLGRNAEARTSLKAALALDAGSTATMLHLAEVLLAEADFEGSRGMAERAAQADPRAAVAHYSVGRALAGLDRHREAIDAFARAEKLAPDAAPIHFSLSASWRRLGATERSAAHENRRAASSQSQVPMADPLMAEVRALRDDAPEHSNRGRTLEQRGDFDGAIREYERALEIDPNYATAHINLVGVYGRMSRFDKAREHYGHAMRIAPASEELNNNWGIIGAMQGQLAEAQASFEKALAANPRSADALFNLGMIAAQRNQNAAARGYFTRALAADPNHAQARQALSQ